MKFFTVTLEGINFDFSPGPKKIKSLPRNVERRRVWKRLVTKEILKISSSDLFGYVHLRHAK